MTTLNFNMEHLPRAFFLAAILLAQQVCAENRIALVIGNAEYKDAPLTNPVNDATDISLALKQLNFSVDTYTNVNRKAMREAIRNFGVKLRKADVGLFYFAGHGIQIKGRNYLVPLSADVHSADEVQDESIDASSVLRKMESAGNAVNIVVLDACRNNPFARSFRSMESGLARMEGPVGSFIAYATAPGSVAADGSGRNGLYTEYLLKALRQPGLSIEQTFKLVRNGVTTATGGQQIPWESSSLMGDFVFLPNNSSAAVPARPAPVPPAVSMKYLQVIANVPNARVTVNHVKRGRISDRGVLNVANLTSNEAEVLVEADGYAPQRHNIKLKEGQWEQLKVTLEREGASTAVHKSANSESRKTTQNLVRCANGKRVLLRNKMRFQQGGKMQSKDNVPALKAALIQALEDYDLDYADVELMADPRSRNSREKRGFQALALRHKLTYLLQATVSVRELPITALKTSMKTVNAEITLEMLEVKSIRTLGSVSRSFSKAGLDPKSVVQRQLSRVLPGMGAELMRQVCRNGL